MWKKHWVIDSFIHGTLVEITSFILFLSNMGDICIISKKDGQLVATHFFTNYKFRLLQFRRLNS